MPIITGNKESNSNSCISACVKASSLAAITRKNALGVIPALPSACCLVLCTPLKIKEAVSTKQSTSTFRDYFILIKLNKLTC